MIAADTAITVVKLLPLPVAAVASIPVPTLAAATAPSVKKKKKMNEKLSKATGLRHWYVDLLSTCRLD